MRIVYLLTSLGIGGAERQVVSLAARMASRGHSVALLVLREKLTHEWPTDLEIVHLGMRRNLFSAIAALLRARRFLKQFNPGVLHSHSFHANISARLLKLLVPAPLVVSTVHNIHEGGRARMLAYRFTDFLSARTTAVSAAVAQRFIHLRAVPRRKCIVVTNGIDTAEFERDQDRRPDQDRLRDQDRWPDQDRRRDQDCRPDADRRAQMRSAMGVTSQFIWLTAGRLVPAKDLPNLLRAFDLVRAASPQTQLWIAGEGNSSVANPSSGCALVAGSFQQVRWLGLRRDLPALFDAADAFVLSSAWEGMPLVIGEAMAMQKPVVATDVGGVQELLGETGLLVPAQNSAALAAAMLALMEKSSADRILLGRAARARIASQFSMDARTVEWEQLYSSLISSCE